MLLRIKERMKKRARYPTMSMIISCLGAEQKKAAFCFQQDRLLKNLEISQNQGLPHDVFDKNRLWSPAGVSACLYLIQNITRGEMRLVQESPLYPTISMIIRALRSPSGIGVDLYLIEKRLRSALAPRADFGYPTMGKKTNGVISIRRKERGLGRSLTSSLIIASILVLLRMRCNPWFRTPDMA
jgi:hypothetical protein